MVVQLRGMLACALFVIALASVQLSLNAARGHRPDTESPTFRLLSDGTSVKPGGAAKHRKVSVKKAKSPAFPRPLKMAGVEIYSRKCASGSGARMKIKLLENSEINGHCKHGAKPAKSERSEKKAPKKPKGAESSPGKRPSPPTLPVL